MPMVKNVVNVHLLRAVDQLPAVVYGSVKTVNRGGKRASFDDAAAGSEKKRKKHIKIEYFVTEFVVF